MTLLDIIFLAIALAMDCFTISIVSGVIMRRCEWPVILRMSAFFGLFQAIMPLLGWLGANYFSVYIESIDHWIAFVLLAFIGGRMVKEALGPEEDIHFSPTRFCTQLYLAVATSIDALAIGISFACLGYSRCSQLAVPLTVIGAVSFLFGVVGSVLGVRCGRAISRRLRPEFVGGIILILIGVKVLVSHLME